MRTDAAVDEGQNLHAQLVTPSGHSFQGLGRKPACA
jgi:hypothetical protein